MVGSSNKVALIGFGEAGQTFAVSGGWARRATTFDIKTTNPLTRAGKLADYAAAGVEGCDGLAAALSGAEIVLSVVTADQAAAAALAAAGHIKPDALYCDMNSVAPDTKRQAAGVVEAAGARYVDVAIMSPVDPAKLRTPLLVSGPSAEHASSTLMAYGFENVRIIEGGVGAASTVKMVRSIMVKGMEALSTECIMAAEAAGVRDEVIASLNQSWPGMDWDAKADYNLDRMMLHGLRRAAEMEEVAKMIASLNRPGHMTESTIRWQKAVGQRRLSSVKGLAAKLGLFLNDNGSAA